MRSSENCEYSLINAGLWAAIQTRDLLNMEQVFHPLGCGVRCLVLDIAIATVYWETLFSALALLLQQLDVALTSH